MSNRVLIAVNGIQTWPGDQRDWNYRACVWTQTRTDYKAMPVEYFCGPIGRAFGQKERARKVSDLLQAYTGHDVTLVGHSNGADVILTALDMALTYPHVAAIHLVSGATDADFDRNGLNEALEDGRVERVAVYCGGKDWALRLASGLVGRALGYGVLGLHGPRNVSAAAAAKLTVVTEPAFGHSTWWEPQRFDRTMGCFFAPEDIVRR